MNYNVKDIESSISGQTLSASYFTTDYKSLLSFPYDLTNTESKKYAHLSARVHTQTRTVATNGDRDRFTIATVPAIRIPWSAKADNVLHRLTFVEAIYQQCEI